ncbi:hypothetical protein HDU77_008739 [Chytriomyces hyalinus]|nr:hypothetical protein HDU77_008739 [Chytriomyces hyalinus]
MQLTLSIAAIVLGSAQLVSAGCSNIKSVMTIVLENTDYSEAIAQSYMGATLPPKGYLLTNYFGVSHPSQGNYIAMVAGGVNGCKSDSNCNLRVKSVADLLEAKGLTWKSYQESYPGNCYTGSRSGTYYRKHNPFMSFTSISGNATRCARNVVASQLDKDAANNALPNYMFYSPDINNDGHDTGAAYADRWLKSFLEPKLTNPAYKDTLFHVVFDESDTASPNYIYSILLGQGIAAAGKKDSTKYTHYSFLATLEGIFDLGNLEQNDATATKIPLKCIA